ncbi:MAG: SufD family Fe-S cluster assembly protein [Longicatena sp.]
MPLILVNDMEYTIQKDGFSELVLEQDADMNCTIVVDKQRHASLLLTYSGIDVKRVLNIHVGRDSTLTLMVKNEVLAHLTLKFLASVEANASLSLALCELNQNEVDVEGTINLKENGASTLLRSATLASNQKHFVLEVQHHAPYTSGIMEHYAIVKETGNYFMQATGKIRKGAYGSASHQTTRVLTMSEKHNSEVIPLLLIDEHDVKASHACTLGQLDEHQLYYLQTRGLSRELALGLLSIGYMMPISEMFEDEEINQKLKNEIEMKVGLHA